MKPYYSYCLSGQWPFINTVLLSGANFLPSFVPKRNNKHSRSSRYSLEKNNTVRERAGDEGRKEEMLKKVFTVGGNGSVTNSWRMITNRHYSSISSAVNSILLRSIKEHYLEVSKMVPPPKVNPPSSFSIVKGALESNGAVLRKTHGNEEITISVMRLANIVPGGGGDDDDDEINQLFLHVDVSKPGKEDSIHFLCGLYPDALGIHSVSMRPKIQHTSSQFLKVPSKYSGPAFQDLDETMRDALHGYIEERGVTESLFPFLQAWLYVKDHRNLMRWFKTIGTFITEPKSD